MHSEYHTTPRAVNTGPSTREDVAHVGRITVALYRRWQNAGGGYTVTARNGRELERYELRTEPAARAKFNALVDRYTPNECDPRDQSEYGVNEWQYRPTGDERAMQSEYRDERDTLATLCQF